MKSQDLLLLLKLASLSNPAPQGIRLRTKGWQDWSRLYDAEGQDGLDESDHADSDERRQSRLPDFSVRGLAEATGISKSQVSLSMRHCEEIGLLATGNDKTPAVNRRGLLEFLAYGAKYVFPVRVGASTRGIATGAAAPVFDGKLFSAAESAQVWPDAYGKTVGQAIAPLTHSVPHAVRRDALLYAMLALLDSIRVGGARERGLAEKELALLLGVRVSS